MPELDLQFARAFVAERDWVYAKTYAKTFPHWYAVRRKNQPDPDFTAMAEMVQTQGVTRLWRGKWATTYLEFDGFKYWTMGEAPEKVICINREPLPDLDVMPGPSEVTMNLLENQ